MKSVKKFFTLSLALILAFGIAMTAEATSTESAGMAALPAGTYTYVDEDPTAETGSNEGQVQFLWTESKLVWAFGATTGVMTGSEALSGDELEFFQGLYLSDRPVYDWLASALRDTDGYAGNVADNLLITINDEGKISKLRLDDGKVQMLAVVSESITADGSIGGIGTLTAENGDITVISGDVEGAIGDVDAPNGTVTLTLASAQAIGNVSGANVVKDIGTVSEKEVIVATPISSTVIVNGETIEFDAYTINSNNYFKIRDIALALSGTEGQFDVYWQDGVANTTITLTSGQAYTTIGGEMSSKGTQETQAELTTWNIYLDRVAVTLTSYSIDGEIYFKLRDLGEAFDFGVEWDSTSNAVIINTSVGYTET